jgi:hypothetical protein
LSEITFINLENYWGLYKLSVKKKNEFVSGFGLAFAFIILAIFVYLSPEYFNSYWVSTIVSSFCMIFGIIGLGTELNKLNNDESNLGFDDLGIGLAFFIIWSVIYYNFQIIWLNYILLVILLIGLYGICTGLASIIHNIFSSDSRTKMAIKIPIGLLQVVATLVTIYEILNKLKIIK